MGPTKVIQEARGASCQLKDCIVSFFPSIKVRDGCFLLNSPLSVSSGRPQGSAKAHSDLHGNLDLLLT
jgi:hypothetical protein